MLKKKLIKVILSVAVFSAYLTAAEITPAELDEIKSYILSVEGQRDRAIRAAEAARLALKKDMKVQRKKRMKYFGLGFAVGAGTVVTLTAAGLVAYLVDR